MVEAPASDGVTLCLLGGGVTGAMYQIGVLAALEDALAGFSANDCVSYFGASSGASIAALLAGGRPVGRIYRAILDPQDQYFPLERRHILKTDIGEWRRTLGSGVKALRHGSASLFSRASPTATALWEELDRFYDTLPAGFFSLEGYEQFLADFFERRSVPNSFRAMPRPLRVLAHDLDSGEPVCFGDPGLEHIAVTRACVASMALPPFFSPVRVGERYYIDAPAAQGSLLDVARRAGGGTLLIVNPMVPVRASNVPTGYGERSSIRDKGLMWVVNQAHRISLHAVLDEKLKRIQAEQRDLRIVRLEPDSTDLVLFMHNPASFAARRKILEYGYRQTREQIGRRVVQGQASLSDLEAAPA